MYLLKTFDESGTMDYQEVFENYGDAVASAVGSYGYEINRVG